MGFAVDKYRERAGGHRPVHVLADPQMPTREVASLRPPDRARAQTTDRHPTPWPVVDQRLMNPHVTDFVVANPQWVRPGLPRDVEQGC
jgi:hypothetical protein